MVRTVTRPKFSWEPLGGSLRITVTTGPRQVSWDIRKNTPPDKLRGMLGEIMTELSAEADLWPADYNPWPGKPMREQCDSIDGVELARRQALTEEESHAALAKKADSFKVTADGMWDRPMDDYDEDSDEAG